MIILALLLLSVAYFTLVIFGRFYEHPLNINAIFNSYEKWTVSVSLSSQEDCVMDKIFLYTPNFIYGDREQKKSQRKASSATVQFVGNQATNKIYLPGKGNISEKHGKILYDQECGLIYFDCINDINSKSAIRPTCLNAPYGNAGAKPIRNIPLRDGLKLYIANYVLTFGKTYVPYETSLYTVAESDSRHDAENPEELKTSAIANLAKWLTIKAYRSWECLNHLIAKGKNKLKKLFQECTSSLKKMH